MKNPKIPKNSNKFQEFLNILQKQKNIKLIHEKIRKSKTFKKLSQNHKLYQPPKGGGVWKMLTMADKGGRGAQ